jgi:hypothetical protein
MVFLHAVLMTKNASQGAFPATPKQKLTMCSYYRCAQCSVLSPHVLTTSTSTRELYSTVTLFWGLRESF